MAKGLLTNDERRTTNDELFKEAKKFIVGGVNSPVRAFRAVGGKPVFIKEGRGAKIYSEDGHEFIDYCLSWGALILGHAHPKVVKELKCAIEKGVSFGAPTKLEVELAKVIGEAVPSIEKVRLTNSGTEAVMGAIRLARGYTGKDNIIRFEGSYHGHADYILNCPGVPADFKKHTLTVPYNDVKRLEETVKRYKEDVAAIIVEPVGGNAGVVLPQDGFLIALRKVADRCGIVLIFDEVITGFRLSYGGAQEYFGVTPDLTCLGKIIGGGLPIGAFGGRVDIMRLLSPEGEVYQAGTFSGNPLTVTAGIATLKRLEEEDPYETLELETKKLCDGIKRSAERRGLKLKINDIASMFSISFADQNLFSNFFHGLLKEGVYLSPSPYETNFLSTAHSAGDIDKTLHAVDNVLNQI